MSTPLKKLFPVNIRTAAIVSIAGKTDDQLLADTAVLLRSADVNVIDYLPERSENTPSYLSADTSDRVRNLNQAINDPSVDLIICARGGFGSMHLLDQIDYATLKRRNLPVMGYSDITALHCAMLARHSGCPIAGSNLLSILQASADPLSTASHYAALDNTQSKFTLQLPCPIAGVTAGDIQITAPASACNLTVLAALCGTSFMPNFSGRILIIEDVNEPVYKVDRLLTQLAMNKVFDGIAALVFGNFSGEACDPDELSMLQKHIAGQIDAPCLRNFPFGHVFPMCAVNSAKKLTLTAGHATLSVAGN